VSDLILVPTVLERERLVPRLAQESADSDYAFQLCGFGAIAAAARAAALIARYRPSRVLLIGIAGSYDLEQVPLGSAVRFDQVACHGIGLGSGPHFVSATQLGWQQFSGGDAQPEIGDLITLDSTFVPGVSSAGMLLTCCAASADTVDARERRSRFPEAVAEDMEGYGVALACSLAGVPLQIVRGISNQVGDRDPRRWQIDRALHAAADMALVLMPRAWLPDST
jgi:futalosine hydrolase